MGPNEGWMVNVEGELKRSRDQLTNLAINQLAMEGQGNYDLPSRIQTPDQTASTSDWIWIRLTSKTTINGQIFYSWREQVKLFTPSGFLWVDSGNGSTFVDYPAAGLNNEDLSVSDGKRYPARWNPDTSQWIFFLKASALPPVPPIITGTHYGIKTWVEWVDRQGLPQLAIPLADDLAKPRIISGGLINNYATNNVVNSDHGKISAYTRFKYYSYNQIKSEPYSYITPSGAARSIPGIGAYDPSTGKSYFLYANDVDISNFITVGTYKSNPSDGAYTISSVKFHFDPDHGQNIVNDVAIGNLHFEWNWHPSQSEVVSLRMTPDAVWPSGGFYGYTSSEVQSIYNALTTWVPLNWSSQGYPYSDPDQAWHGNFNLQESGGAVDVAWSLATRSRRLIYLSSSPVKYGEAGIGLQSPIVSGTETWEHEGDHFPGGPLGYGRFKVIGGRVDAQIGGYSIKNSGFGPVGIEFKWNM